MRLLSASQRLGRLDFCFPTKLQRRINKPRQRYPCPVMSFVTDLAPLVSIMNELWGLHFGIDGLFQKSLHKLQ